MISNISIKQLSIIKLIIKDSRKEDGIIAFTWWHFLTDPTSDAEYLLRLPMTKGAVKVNFLLFSRNLIQTEKKFVHKVHLKILNL